jgi:uncharacterized phage protein (TIGR01671 family)
MSQIIFAKSGLLPTIIYLCNKATIKFRAYDKPSKTMSPDVSELFWSAGGLRATGLGYYIGEGEHKDLVDDDHIVLMQFTGLLDKNGKEIYEGDVVKLDSWNPSVCEVVFNRGGFCFRFTKDDGYYPDGKYLEEGEVIGNIYQNPELLNN